MHLQVKNICWSSGLSMRSIVNVWHPLYCLKPRHSCQYRLRMLLTSAPHFPGYTAAALSHQKYRVLSKNPRSALMRRSHSPVPCCQNKSFLNGCGNSSHPWSHRHPARHPLSGSVLLSVPERFRWWSCDRSCLFLLPRWSSDWATGSCRHGLKARRESQIPLTAFSARCRTVSQNWSAHWQAPACYNYRTGTQRWNISR